MEKVRNNNCPWVLLFLTNAMTKGLSIKRCISKHGKLSRIYGYKYASRAQFFWYVKIKSKVLLFESHVI